MFENQGMIQRGRRGVRTATVVVAAANSLHSEQADYVCDGVDDQTTIQTAVNDAGDIYFMGGTYTKSDADGIELKSNTSLILANDAVFSLVDGLDDDACFFTNADHNNGNENINILGGKFDCNRAGQSAGYQFLADFENVSGGKIDSTIVNFTMLEAKLKTSNVDLHNQRYDVKPIILAPCEAIEEFDISGSGTFSIDASGVVGDNCLKYIGTNTDRGSADIVLPDGIDVEAYAVDCWIKIEDVSSALSVVVGGSGPGSIDVVPNTDELMKLMQDDTWYHITLPLTYYILNDVPTLRIRFTPAAGETVTGYIDHIMLVPVSPKPHVSFGFDDGIESATQETLLGAEIMAKYGFAGSVHPMGPQYCGSGYLSIDELDLIYFKYHWDICTHANHHWDNTTTDDAIDIGTINRRFIEDNGWVRGASYLVYAGHDTTGEINDIVRKKFSAYRNPLILTIWGVKQSNSIINFAAQTPGTETSYTPNARELEAMRRHIWFQHYTHFIQSGQCTPEYLDSFCQFWYDWGLALETPSQVLGLNRQQTVPMASHTVVDMFMDVLAASTTYVHGAITGTGAELEVTTAITNPDVTRSVSITTTNNSSPTGDVTIWGINGRGVEISEDLTISAGSTVESDKAFATVTKIVLPAGVTAADTVAVGIGDKLGLSDIIYRSTDVKKVKQNNADITVPTVDAAHGTVDCSINAGDDFAIWYSRT